MSFYNFYVMNTENVIQQGKKTKIKIYFVMIYNFFMGYDAECKYNQDGR